MTTQQLPLDGIKVIDFTQVMLGPCATQVLADYGADVIKIERPGSGDLSRWAITDPAGLDNPVFASLNRNKRSIALDLRGEAGKSVVRDLVRGADIVVSNFRAGVMERMGFGYADLRELNKRIIYAFGSGFGPTGPNAHKGGQDVLAQALSGVMMRRSDPSHPLAIYPTALADYAAGMHLVQGVLLALLQRERSGEGQAINVSLYNSMLAMQMQEAAMWLMRERELNWGAMPLSGAFATSDGALVMVGAFKTNPLQEICAALDLEDLSADPRYDSAPKQAEQRSVLQAIFRERFAGNTTTHWIARLEARDLLCAPVRSLAEALADPQTVVNQMVAEASVGNQAVRLVASPIDLSAAPFAIRRLPPTLGEHGEGILAELGYDADRVAALKSAGVLG
jgi:crotonobetainyl-CoA:carnitine CoA-transferase CaiB-like acyl-CoA transferase